MTAEGERLLKHLHSELARWWADAAKLEGKGTKVPAGTLRRRMQGVSWQLKAIAKVEGLELS